MEKPKIGTLTPEQVKKRIKLINRNHKLYVRDANGTLRRLDKLSRHLYETIIVLFLKGDGERRYSMLNEGVTIWSDLKPLQLPIEENLHIDLIRLRADLRFPLKDNSGIVVSYNGSWKPLVNMFIKEKEEITE